MDEIFEDLKNREWRLKDTKAYERRKFWSKVYLAIALVVLVFAFCKWYQSWMNSQHITRQQAITRIQIENGIAQNYHY